MKKLFILIISVAALFSCNQQKEYVITGNLTDIEEGTVILEQRAGGETIVIDSTEILNGSFTLTGSVTIPDLYYLRISGERRRLSLFVENTEIVVSGHGDSLYKAEVAGSLVQDELKAFNDGLDAIYAKMSEMYTDYRAAQEANDQEKIAAIEAKYDELDMETQHIQNEYIAGHPASYITPYLILRISYELEVDEIEELLVGLDDDLADSQILKDLWGRVEVLKSVAIGQHAPEFTQNNQEGIPVALSSLLGDYLLIDFWASWCGPCRRENPNIVAAYGKYHEKGFDILGVSLDQSEENWLEAIEADQLTWNHVSDLEGWGNAAAALYGVNSIPSSVLLDREGKIIARNLRGEDLHNTLAELLD